MTIKGKKRIGYAITTVIILLIEVLIALYVDDKFIRPFGGDILVVILLCCLVRIICPERIRALALWALIFSIAVEIAQYFDFVDRIGLGHIRFFRIIMGTDFSFIDILCYAIGCLIFFIAEAVIKRLKGKA